MAGFWLFSSDWLPGLVSCAVTGVGGARGCSCVCVHVDGCGWSCVPVGADVGLGCLILVGAGPVCSCPHAGVGGFRACGDAGVVLAGVEHGCVAGVSVVVVPVADRVWSCAGVSVGCSSVVPGVFCSGVSCGVVVFSCGCCVSCGGFSVYSGFCGHCPLCVCSGVGGCCGACGCSYGVAGVSSWLVVCVPVLVIVRACWVMAVIPVVVLVVPVLLLFMPVRRCGCSRLSLCVYGLVPGSASVPMSVPMLVSVFMPVPVVVAVLSYVFLLAVAGVVFVSACALADVCMVDVLVDVPVGLWAVLLWLFESGCRVLSSSSLVLSSLADAGSDVIGGSWVMVCLRADMGLGMYGGVGGGRAGYADCGYAVAVASSDHGHVDLCIVPVLVDVSTRGGVCVCLLFGRPLMLSGLWTSRVDTGTGMDADSGFDDSIHAHVPALRGAPARGRGRQTTETGTMVPEGGR